MKKIYLAEDTISKNELNSLASWIVNANQLTKGRLCKKFENLFAQWQGSKFAIFVNSGSSANLLMVQALYEQGKLKNKKVIYVNYELPKSFIVCRDKIYVCPLNTATLFKRCK